MIVPLSQRLLTVLCALVVVFVTATASAQEPLTKAKALYDAAAYEEALILLASMNIPAWKMP